MKRIGLISVMTVLALASIGASAQGRPPRSKPAPANPPAAQRRGFDSVPNRGQAAPAQQPPQWGRRGEARGQGQAPSQEQPPQDRRPAVLYHGPGPHSGQWLLKHEEESRDQQIKELESDPSFQHLAPERQQQLRNRLDHFLSLPPQQRTRVLQRMETLEHMPPEQQQKVHQMFRDFRALPIERRRVLTQAFSDLEGLSPQDRQKKIDSDDFRQNYSDQELNLLRGMSVLGVAPSRPNE